MHKFEKATDPIISRQKWHSRVLCSVRMALFVVGGALAIGVLGYHYLGDISWIDSFLEASMILGGMGAISPMQNDAVKIFASVYALFSTFVVLGIAVILWAPWAHRLLHHFHAEIGKS